MSVLLGESSVFDSCSSSLLLSSLIYPECMQSNLEASRVSSAGVSADIIESLSKFSSETFYSLHDLISSKCVTVSVFPSLLVGSPSKLFRRISVSRESSRGRKFSTKLLRELILGVEIAGRSGRFLFDDSGRSLARYI